MIVSYNSNDEGESADTVVTNNKLSKTLEIGERMEIGL